MFAIRSAQTHVLMSDQIEAFRRGLVDHAHRFFPRHCSALGEDGLDEWIEIGLERAREHGFSSERDLCKYLNLTFTFGSDFDSDPTLIWAREALSSGGLATPRMDRLYAAALDHHRDERVVQ